MIIPVVLCGGAGSRLWPASRETYPKQLFAFGGGRSLLQDTLARVLGAGYGKPIIVTGNDYRFLVAEQVLALDAEADIVIEPLRRDSCAAIAAAAMVAIKRDPEAILLVLAADHAIPDLKRFQEHVERGLTAARTGQIVTFGIRPSHPATGYGYLQPGARLDGTDGVCELKAFVEKPDEPTACRYVADGYLWNSGNFLFKADVFLRELERLAPDIYDPVQSAVELAQRDLDFLRLDREAFAKARGISVDYAVMEKTALSAVVPSDFPWSDIGSWAAVWELTPKDDDGNAVTGECIFQDAKNSYVYSPGILTSVVGLDDVIAVVTRDAVLIAAKSKAEAVKALVARLGKAGRREVVEHPRRFFPWGQVDVLEVGDGFQVKRMVIKPNETLAARCQDQRAEHWTVVRGAASVTIGATTHLVQENESIVIPIGSVHQLANPGQVPLEVIEVVTGRDLRTEGHQRAQRF